LFRALSPGLRSKCPVNPSAGPPLRRALERAAPTGAALGSAALEGRAFGTAERRPSRQPSRRPRPGRASHVRTRVAAPAFFAPVLLAAEPPFQRRCRDERHLYDLRRQTGDPVAEGPLFRGPITRVPISRVYTVQCRVPVGPTCACGACGVVASWRRGVRWRGRRVRICPQRRSVGGRACFGLRRPACGRTGPDAPAPADVVTS